MKSEIAENIKIIIKEKGLLQKTVAREAGYTAKTFNNMLNHRKVIKDCDIVPIAKALKVDPNALFGYINNTKTA